MDIRFVSNNEYKIKEVKDILSGKGINIIPFDFKLDELQTDNIEKLLEDKVLKAFKKVGRPLIVEHTGLYVDSLNGFPGILTQLFWDTIKADKFASIFGSLDNILVEAKTVVGYCDGKNIHFFEGSIRGKISKKPYGNTSFQWDCVFIPNGYDKTFAQMGKKKYKISQFYKSKQFEVY